MKRFVLMTSLFCSFVIWGDSSEVIPGEYLFSSSEVKEQQNIKKDFKEYGPVSTSVVNDKTILFRFVNDPGLKRLQLILKKRSYKGSLQPNFKYKLIKPIKPENDRRLHLKEINLKQE